MYELVVLFVCVAIFYMPVRAAFKMFLYILDPMKGKQNLGGFDEENDK